MSTTTTITAALERANKLRGRYAFVICQFFPVKQPGLGNIMADRFLRLYYDEGAIATWELDWAVARILVATEHYFRRHSARQEGRDEICWQVATEIAITGDLSGEKGIVFPPGTLFPSSFSLPDSLSAEEYSERLFQLCRRRRNQLEQSTDELLSEAAGVELPTFGSAGAEELREWELPEESAQALDGMLAAMAFREMEFDQTVPGSAPGSEVRTTDEHRESQYDWRMELFGLHAAALSTKPGTADWSYLVPDPDFGLNQGIVMPGMVGTDSNTAVVVDSSLSMGAVRLAHAKAEVLGVLKRCETRVWLFSVDAAVHGVREITHAQQIEIVGGGGTDMGVGIYAAARHIPRPDIIIVITDGDTGWPDAGPIGIPVIVVLVGTREKIPSWVKKVIKIKI